MRSRLAIFAYKSLLCFILLDVALACFYTVRGRLLGGWYSLSLGVMLVLFHLLLVTWARSYGLRANMHLLYPMLIASLTLLAGLILHFFL
ncbi:hypothetical protein SAMN05880558_109164 [Aeromonas sp. RU39B]|jgi:hypothetical protein|uniref:hypothetical protein n=1 Tax=Aeromonas sp. RU39B TaxID=1907416 RepID=UPI000953AF70|nr:hypothetical protein [Aeromonas sp. RU39B]SIR17478.1 hypothetical protein SAMN05880558_109164 [Aeromonas sp. RU39B]